MSSQRELVGEEVGVPCSGGKVVEVCLGVSEDSLCCLGRWR